MRTDLTEGKEFSYGLICEYDLIIVRGVEDEGGTCPGF
jgi:hypothetical protein